MNLAMKPPFALMILATPTLFLGMALGLSTSNFPRHGIFSFERSVHHGRIPSPSMHYMKGSNTNDDDFASTSTRGSNEQPPLPSQAELDVLKLVQSHFSTQALLAVMRLGVLDVLHNAKSLTVDEAITRTHRLDESHNARTINRDALFRCLRLLCNVGVIKETTKSIDGVSESAFLLTEMGQLLQQPESSDTSGMASFVLHWAELPLWNAWSELPDYVAGYVNSQDSLPESDGASSNNSPSDISLPPFDRANGMTASDYYKNNPESCSHRNAVARYASSKEITSILDAMQFSSVLNESNVAGKTIVDIGGGYGDLMDELEKSMPSVLKTYCLDLPDVIDDAISTNKGDKESTATVLVPGNMFDPSTIPPCDFIFTKHVLCDFSDEDVVRALQSFHEALSKGGKVVIMDAVLPNGNDLNGKWNSAVSFDVLLMLTGRRGERSQLEWSNLASKAGFVLDEALSTSSVTVDLAILTQA
ncbi:hypothetical protein ACHAXR_002403 [Thalassiosira sp. AJA248-18]